MDGSPIAALPVTVSPRMPVDELCRVARNRLNRDGVAELVATTGDGRQMRQLARVAHRLAGDGLLCSRRVEGAGTVLTVVPPAGYAVAWYPGTPKV